MLSYNQKYFDGRTAIESLAKDHFDSSLQRETLGDMFKVLTILEHTVFGEQIEPLSSEDRSALRLATKKLSNFMDILNVLNDRAQAGLPLVDLPNGEES